MELKNNFSLSKDEASDLLYRVANSLKNRGKFEISLPNQEISLNIGEEFNATLIASDTRFSLDFKWKAEETKDSDDVDWRVQFDKDMAEAGLPIGESESPPVPVSSKSKPGPMSPVTTSSTITATISELRTQDLGPRRFPERMVLETTTLPYEGGVWNPAFNLSSSTHWTEIGIDNKLENTKWISDEQLEAMENSPRPQRKSLDSSDEEGLFDDLDDTSAHIAGTKRPQGGVRRRTTRQVVTPAAMIHHASTMAQEIDSAEINEAVASWSEPEKETTSDEWVKPSEFIAQKGKSKPPTPTPGPPAVKSSQSAKLDEQVLGWKEPESSSTADDWVKPSEILKKKNEVEASSTPPPTPQKGIVDTKKTRPPPVAPDQPPSPGAPPKPGKKKDKDEDKKGWASWNE